MRKKSIPPTRALAEAMGFRDSKNLEPYLAYIESHAPGGHKLEPWVQLFIEIVNAFQTDGKKIEAYIDALSAATPHFYFDTILRLPIANNELRRNQIGDIVFRMLGIWTLMGSYFVPLSTPFTRLLDTGKASGGETLASLVEKSLLLPHPKEVDFPKLKSTSLSMRDTALFVHSSLASMESLTIDPSRLNAYRLSTFAHTKIHWTTNVSRHMLLSKHGGRDYLELFALPCTLDGRPEEALRKIGLSPSLVYEIRDSYAALFNAHNDSHIHRKTLRWLGASWWCWCLLCSSRRLLQQQIKTLKASPTLNHRLGEPMDPGFDPILETLAGKRASLWSQSRFRNLWPRIIALDAHLQKVRPWGFWVLFRDRRDTLQFWSFLFGTLILMLTCVQVALGIAQVIGTF